MFAGWVARSGRCIYGRVAQSVRAHPVGVQRIMVKVINTGGDTLADEVTGSIPVTATITILKSKAYEKEYLSAHQ